MHAALARTTTKVMSRMWDSVLVIIKPIFRVVSKCNSTNSPGFTGHDYSYVCSEGKQFVCCNSETDFLSNVQDLGQCQRNTTPRKPTRRPTRRPTHQPTNHPTEND
jgi:hypothetical protein